jgi:hypothetical protein
MDEDRIAELTARIEAMTEKERRALDPISAALEAYQREHYEGGGRCLPNRVIALACVNLMAAWEKTLWERD